MCGCLREGRYRTAVVLAIVLRTYGEVRVCLHCHLPLLHRRAKAGQNAVNDTLGMAGASGSRSCARGPSQVDGLVRWAVRLQRTLADGVRMHLR